MERLTIARYTKNKCYWAGTQACGHPMEYTRVAITDMKAPKSSDFDTLAENIASTPSNTTLVFNCQMGWGRATTGTFIACLVQLRFQFGWPLRSVRTNGSSVGDVGSSSGDNAGNNSLVQSSPILRLTQLERPKAPPAFVMDDIPILRKMTRLLENGVECKEALDSVIDLCGAMQNIRHDVLQ